MKIRNKLGLNGRFTIPLFIRELLDIKDGDNLLIDIDEDTQIITIEKENKKEWVTYWTR